MTPKRLASLLAPALMLASIGCDDAEPPATPLLVAKVAQAPVVDGLIDPGLWDTARRSVLALHKSQGRAHRPEKIEAVVRAVYADERIAFLVQWQDDCQSDKYRPYVWDTIAENEKYVVGTSVDDGVALIFQTATQHDARRPGQTECWTDLWDWGAGRTNSTTYARDAMLLITAVPTAPGAKPFRPAWTGQRLWAYDPDDEGSPAFKIQSPGAKYDGDKILPYVPQQPTGSLADVKAIGQWDEDQKLWSVEFSRRLDTGHPDDIAFDPSASAYMALSITIVDLHGYPATYRSPRCQVLFGGGAWAESFDDAQPGKAAPGFLSHDGKWLVKHDLSAPSPPMVLGQVAFQDSPQACPKALYVDGVYADFTVSAAMRLLPGPKARTGGIVFRYSDAQNYYAMEINGDRGEVRLVGVSRGQATDLCSAVKCDIACDVWYDLRVECQGPQVVCFLDDREILRALAPEHLVGRLGLYVEGLTIAHFDDLAVEPKVSRQEPGEPLGAGAADAGQDKPTP